MRKLLSANLSRLWKDKIFWLCAVCVLLVSVMAMLADCRYAAENKAAGYAVSLEQYYFNTVPFMGIFIAVFTAMFLGTEYSDGTIRNKVTVGHTRTDIYLAGFITCCVGSVLLLTAGFLGGLVGVPAFGLWSIDAAKLLGLLAVAVLFTVALTAIFTVIGMLVTHKAFSVVFAIFLFLAMLIAASSMYNRLCELEFYSGIMITSEGMQMSEPSLNPDYLTGTARTVYEWLLDILPTGQSILLSNLETARPLRQMISSVAVTVLSVLCGMLVFRKKDLK